MDYLEKIETWIVIIGGGLITAIVGAYAKFRQSKREDKKLEHDETAFLLEKLKEECERRGTELGKQNTEITRLIGLIDDAKKIIERQNHSGTLGKMREFLLNRSREAAAIEIREALRRIKESPSEQCPVCPECAGLIERAIRHLTEDIQVDELAGQGE